MNTNKAKVIIQARVGSTRLPGKVLLDVMGRTMLHYLIEKVKKAKNIEDIIIATTIKEQDLPIVVLAQKLQVKIYRGSEDDVLDRYYQAAKAFNLRHIVRITADCPLMDPEIIDKIVHYYFKSGADYCCNVLKRTFPTGEDVEVFSFSTLKYTWEHANLASEREHVTPYIMKHPEVFKLKNVTNKTDLSRKRWTLDRMEDFKFVKAVIEKLYHSDSNFHMKDILKLLKSDPGLEAINKNVISKEGYLKSLREDRVLKSRV